jgi:hypothetical protein
MVYKKSLLFVMIMLTVGGSLVHAHNQSQQVEYGVEQERIETFEGFDEFDEAVEAAIDKGILRDKPEMRQPSSVEVVARRMVSYLFMKYLALKDSISYGYESSKAWLYSIWSALVNSSSHE